MFKDEPYVELTKSWYFIFRHFGTLASSIRTAVKSPAKSLYTAYITGSERVCDTLN